MPMWVLEDLGMENVVKKCGRLEYLITIGYILLAFGNFVVNWHIFPRFGILRQEKSGNSTFYNQQKPTENRY
jgi:hypothetical protein